MSLIRLLEGIDMIKFRNIVIKISIHPDSGLTGESQETVRQGIEDLIIEDLFPFAEDWEYKIEVK
jgi:hypothetical protein